MPVNCWSPQEVMKISESRRRQLERAASSVAENLRLCESVKTLEKMLGGAHADQDKLRAEKTQLEADNWELKNQLGDGVGREKSKALGPSVYFFYIFSLPMLTEIVYWCRAC